MTRSRSRGSNGSASKLSRRSALALLGGGALLTVSGVSAYDMVRGDRRFSIGVEGNDPDAILGIETHDKTVQHGGQEQLLTLTNNFDTAFSSVTVTFYPEDLQISPGQRTVSIAANGVEDISLVVNCQDGEITEDLSFSIVAEGQGQSFETTEDRTVTITCTPPADDPGIPIAGVNWRGGGNLEIIPENEEDEDTEITVDVWVYTPGTRGPPPSDGADEGEFEKRCDIETKTNTQIQPDVRGEAPIVAINIQDARDNDKVWHHPEFDPEERSIEQWRAGDGIRWNYEPFVEDTLPGECD